MKKTVRLLENMPIVPQNSLIIQFLVDFSGSMLNTVVYNKTRKALLISAFDSMVNEIYHDRLLYKCCSFGVCTFNDTCTNVRTIASLEEDSSIPVLEEVEATGNTDLGNAVITALTKIDKKASELRARRTNVLKPVLVILSDGEANGDPSLLQKAVKIAKAKTDKGELNILPVAIGNSTGESLADFGNVLQVDDLNMGDVFKGIAAATKASIGTQSSNAFNDLVKSAISWSKI